MTQPHHKGPESRFQPKPPLPVIDIIPAVNIQSLVVIVLRLTALNFLLRVVLEISTPLLAATGMFPRPADDAPMAIGWVLAGGLVLGAIFLWALAAPFARLIAQGVPHELSLDNLSLADCYSIAFLGVGTVYMVGHLPGVWNWSLFFARSIFHRLNYPLNDPARSYDIANAFIPFIVGMILVWKRRNWAVALAGTGTHRTVISLNEPRWTAARETREPIKISIDAPPK